jgi:integrase
MRSCLAPKPASGGGAFTGHGLWPARWRTSPTCTCTTDDGILAAAEAAGPQSSAFFALALDTGARKGELCGLRWADVDLTHATVTITRQLLKPGIQPVFGTPKRDRSRVVDLAPETVARLKIHRRAQTELKLRNRTAYHDLGLVFAKEWGDLHRREDSLGLPLQSNNLGQREFAPVIKAAKVRPITFHGLRHTSATLLLINGEPVHVVSAVWVMRPSRRPSASTPTCSRPTGKPRPDASAVCSMASVINP